MEVGPSRFIPDGWEDALCLQDFHPLSLLMDPQPRCIDIPCSSRIFHVFLSPWRSPPASWRDGAEPAGSARWELALG